MENSIKFSCSSRLESKICTSCRYYGH